MKQLNKTLELMRTLCGEGCRFQNFNQMADYLGLSDNEKPGFYKILSGTTRPRADRLLIWLEKLGFEIIPPWEHNVDARKDLLERADSVMSVMIRLGINDSDRARIYDALMGR